MASTSNFGPFTTSINDTNFTQEPATAGDKPAAGALTFVQQSAPLLRLPGELLNKIYRYHFSNEVVDGDADVNKLGKYFRMLSVCRQIRYEAKPILFKEVFPGHKCGLWQKSGDDFLDLIQSASTLGEILSLEAPEQWARIKLYSTEPQEAMFKYAEAIHKEYAAQMQLPIYLSINELFQRDLDAAVAKAPMCHCPGLCTQCGDLYFDRQLEQGSFDMHLLSRTEDGKFYFSYDGESSRACIELYFQAKTLNWKKIESALVAADSEKPGEGA